MLSVPHMIVVFLVVLVVFGPQKLPELARSLGKLMAEFRKASGDFKSAFEEEMRDLERQARLTELKRQAAEASAAVADGAKNLVPAATLGSSAGTTETLPVSTGDNRQTEAPVITPVGEAIPRIDASAEEAAQTSKANGSSASGDAQSANEASASEGGPFPTHDKQQPA
jgi:TatA/E family protein of Tat protein translocase